MTGNYAQVPGPAADYFTHHPDGHGMPDHPVIVRQYRPDHGWTRYPIRKRVSGAWLRKMLNEDGATEVTLACGGREVDFRVAELLSQAKRPARDLTYAEAKALAGGDPDLLERLEQPERNRLMRQACGDCGAEAAADEPVVPVHFSWCSTLRK